MHRIILLCFLLSACNGIQTKTDATKNKQDVQQPSQTNTTFPEYAKLQGKWISEADKNYSLEFEQNMFVEKSGSQRDFSEYVLLNQCGTSENTAATMAGVYIGFKIGDTDETYCQYEIMDVTDKTLSLVVVENGKALMFHKQ
ncbi:MAG: hypothetical protein ACTHJT_08190 [Cytophaga sp.]|uniref:hypothetical protein n=1 Tax=Cytophaga sp. TaxID=29535 RepID=UPI003F7E46AF